MPLQLIPDSLRNGLKKNGLIVCQRGPTSWGRRGILMRLNILLAFLESKVHV